MNRVPVPGMRVRAYEQPVRDPQACMWMARLVLTSSLGTPSPDVQVYRVTPQSVNLGRLACENVCYSPRVQLPLFTRRIKAWYTDSSVKRAKFGIKGLIRTTSCVAISDTRLDAIFRCTELAARIREKRKNRQR